MVKTRLQRQKSEVEASSSLPFGETLGSPAAHPSSTANVGEPAGTSAELSSRHESRAASRRSCLSGSTNVARTTIEAQHVRRLVEIERREIELKAAMLQLDRKVAEADLQAELTAIGKSRSGSSRSHLVESWLQNVVNPDGDTAVEPIVRQPGVNAPVVPAPPSQEITIHPTSCNLPNVDHNGNNNLAKAIEGLTSVLSNRSKSVTVNLPTFDGGSATEWLSFKRIFMDTQKFYSAGENLTRLNNALKGTAREAVYVLLVSARDPQQVLNALENRFGCPERIVLQELKSVRALPKVSTEGNDLAIFACRVQNCVEIIRLMDQSDYLRSPELFNALISKLSPLLRARWLDYAVNHDGGKSKLELLSEFLSREVNLQTKFGISLETHYVPSSSSQPPYRTQAYSKPRIITQAYNRGGINNASIHSDFDSEIKSEKLCIFCKGRHDIVKCDNLLSLSIDDRWKWVKLNKVCHRCLQKRTHRFKFCKNKSSCGKEGCVFKHHQLLHNSDSGRNVVAHADLAQVMVTSSSSSSQTMETRQESSKEHAIEEAAHSATTSHCLKRPLRSLLKIIAVKITGPTASVNTYALLDDGCTTTLVDSNISKRIGAVGPRGNMHINCIGGLSKVSEFSLVNFTLQGLHSSDTYEIHGARSIENLDIKCQRAVHAEDINMYHHLKDITDYICFENAQPTIIIGMDNCHLLVPISARAGKISEPIAIQTALGWMVCGPILNNNSRQLYSVVTNNIETGESCNIDELIKEHYKLDSIGIVKNDYRGVSDAHALQTLSQTVKRLPNGHFEAGLLWRPGVVNVPNNYKLALQRFLSLEQKMQKDSKYAEMYRQNIHAMIDKNYAEECVSPPSGIVWYLPHFGVTHPHKPGKLRVVHDAAAKFQGTSLNSLLLPGPDLLQPLLGILMRFREHPVALTADIREMFPQVKIRVQDRDAQRFLWRDDPSKKIRIYRMSSMIFGACSSPCTALFVKNANADEFRDEFPEAAHASVLDTYMDDYIGSHENVEKAARIAADIVELNKRGGFEMRGWVSNNIAAMSLLPKDLISEKCFIKCKDSVELGSSTDSQTIRILGLIWKPYDDVITFSTGLEDGKKPSCSTKRDVLSYLMRVYDPLGILGPIISRGRIMFQNLWRKNLKWDDKLPQAELERWDIWFKDLSLLINLKIPRCYSLRKSRVIERELHIFCDASELAYAAVAYWRIIYADGDVQIALISSKSRVAPLKPTSIPRLELQGALLATRLATFITNNHTYSKPARRIFWCDSLNVLGWIRSDARSYKPFVAHRLGEILEVTQVNEWRWVPTNFNVADDATRIKHQPLCASSRWLVGPDFLLASESSWPSFPPVDMANRNISHDSERKSSCIVNLVNSDPSPMPLVVSSDRLSSWIRLVRATAKAHKFIDLLRRRGTKNITAEDLRKAEIHLLRQSQLEAFPEEIYCLRNRQPLPRKSKMVNLSPIIDEDQLLRLKGRIDGAADIDYQIKRPIILDSRNRTVRLLIAHYHVKAAHGNTEMIVNELRQFYWIIHLRSAVRSVAYECRACRIRRAQPFDPPMGDLPTARLGHHKRAFTHTGLDYFGPIQVAVGRRKEKRYVALFTCLVTRAVHLELVYSLSTDAAVMGLRRFIARRGVPAEIWSDNGTAFVGVSRLLRSLYGEAIETFAANERISWKFIPPSAPFMGGAWERLVRSIKTAMRVTLKERIPSDEILITLLCEAEALVNSRPLTYVSSEPYHEEALTPFHFLLGSSSGKSIPVHLEDSDLINRAKWKRTVRLADHFWSRWIKEYLPTLLPRGGRGTVPQLKVGDLVFIVDDQLPRGSWPRGKITMLCPGRDGIIRVADVQTSTGVFRRPLKKLVPLPT